MPPLSVPQCINDDDDSPMMCAEPCLRSPQPTQKLMPRKRQRHIRFNRGGTGIHHIHINDYSSEEIQNCWYSPEEYSAMRSAMRQDVSDLRRAIQTTSGKPDEEPSVCRIGIECRLPEMRKLRDFSKARSIKAVLSEQQYQWRECAPDSGYLAIAYARVTASSAMAARRRGATIATSMST